MILRPEHVPFEGAPGRVYRVLGPPGTGKTSWLVEQSERAVVTYGPAAVRLVSMTRAAKFEFARRKSALPDENVTTLHALAYRALDRPKLLSDAHRAAWVERFGPVWGALTTIDPQGNEDGFGAPSSSLQPKAASLADEMLQQLDLMRAKLDPVDPHTSLGRFAADFTAWKRELGAVDFLDLLEMALDECPTAPGNPDVLLVDEAQDLSALELALVEQWGSHCRVVVLVGDPDQSIYAWRGSDPRVLLGAPPWKVMEESYRVPAAIHEYAMACIRKSSTASGAAYRPRKGATGSVDRMGRNPMDVVSRIEAMLQALADAGANRDREHIDIMLLASCGYMLNPFVSLLRRMTIPYCNPFRSEWNPLARGTPSRVTVADRLAAFASLRTGRDWRLAVEPLRARRGANPGPVVASKAEVEALADNASPQAVVEWLRRVLVPDAWEHFDRGPDEPPSTAALQWWLGASTGTRAAAAEYAVGCAVRWGVEETLHPRLCVGTVHSVKGGQADHVMLSTELSGAAQRQMSEPGWFGEDSIYRQFYVGITRARESLTMLDKVAGVVSTEGNEVSL